MRQIARARGAGNEPARRRGPPPKREAFEATLARLAAEQETSLAAFRRAAADAEGGRRLVGVALLPTVEAVADPAIGPSAYRALVAAYGAAHGRGDGVAMADCFGCCRPWTARRPPVGVVVITTTKPDALGLALACEACAAGPESRRILGDAAKRDFLGGEGEELPVHAFSPEGRA